MADQPTGPSEPSDDRPGVRLAAWYAANGRHHIGWRTGASRWEVLVAETMACQTQIDRVAAALGPFLERFPTPEAAVAAGQSELVRAWGRLGYPRRARNLYAAASRIVASGWPDELEDLPGVGPWVAAAVVAQADDADRFACDVNVRRVAQRYLATTASDRVLADRLPTHLSPLRGRDLLLSVLDLGAQCCTRREPSCDRCPIAATCATRGPLAGEHRPARQAPYEGSLRARRGAVLAALRSAPQPTTELPEDAVTSLVADGLVVVADGHARLA